ncbi:MAG: hypothetical protein GY931_11800 [Maribacter sp.]|nr:hypothetical protein [Maribacter sp.]
MDKEALVELIETAFKNVRLGDGIGIFEAEAIDNYASEKETLKARAKDRKEWKNWTEIPREVIETFCSVLCFVDLEGMRFVLPAYMKFSVENHKTNASASIDSPIYALSSNPVFVEPEVDKCFTKEQYVVFAKFLKFMVLDAGEDYVDSFSASQAYEKYWAKYDSNMA